MIEATRLISAYVIGNSVVCAPCVANHGNGIDTTRPIFAAPSYRIGDKPAHRCAVCGGGIR